MPKCFIRPTVLVTEVISEEGLVRLRKFAEVRYFARSAPMPEEETITRIIDVDAVLVRATRISREILRNANRLKVIAKHGAGLDNIDLRAAREKGVIVTSTPTANSESVAEFVLALMLAFSKNLLKADSLVRKMPYLAAKRQLESINIELSGKTLGVIGFGNIGSRVASKASALGMQVLAYDPYVTRRRKRGVRMVKLPRLLRESDIVTVNCALNKRTLHMIGERELRLMKHTAFIINTARGEIIEQKSLAEALQKEIIAGACLDVTESDTLSAEDPLRKMSNVILTPHVAGATHESLVRMSIQAAEEIIRVLGGQQPLWPVKRS